MSILKQALGIRRVHRRFFILPEVFSPLFKMRLNRVDRQIKTSEYERRHPGLASGDETVEFDGQSSTT